jgi:hypothetical protein
MWAGQSWPQPAFSRPFALVVLAACAVCAAHAQTAFVSLSSPARTVLVGGRIQLSASLTDLYGTPLDPSTLAWSASDSTIGSVTGAGVVRGVLPGDLTVTAADATSGASAAMLLHVVPLGLAVQPPSLEIAAGATAQVQAQATDANGAPIPAVKFQFRSGETSVAGIADDGTVTAVAEGFATLEARIAGVSSDAALVSTIPIHVLPAPLYKIRKVLSTDVAAATTVLAYQTVSAENASEIAAIATLANGSQAAVLIEGGKQKVLAVTGQALPNGGRMVMRIDGISANARGDVALLIEYPTQWCLNALIVFPHGQPGQEIAAGNCSNGLNVRSMGEDGTVLYRINDQILRGSATAPPRLLFSLLTQPTMPDPVRNVNDFYPSRGGTFLLNTNLVSGAHVYFYYDGKTLSQVYKDGDNINGRGTNNLGNFAATGDGTFYAGAYSNGYSGLVKLAPGGVRAQFWSGDPVPGGNFGWVQAVADAGPAGVLLATDLSVGPYHTSLAVWDGTKLTEYSHIVSYAALVGGALFPSGTALATVALTGDTSLPLRTFASDGSSNVVLAAGAPFPQTAPPGIDWHYAPRGGGAGSIPLRAEGDVVLNVGATVQPLASVGSMLPDGNLALWIGGAVGNESGDLLFTAGYSNGSGIFRYRAGALDTLIDTTMTGKGPNGTTLNWVNSYRGRYLAMNKRGDAAVIANFNNATRLVFFGSAGPVAIAQQNLLAPSGATYTNFQNVAIDDNGRVMFIAATSDGHNTAYFWDGKTVQPVIGTGDPGPWGFTVNEISNIAGAGAGFVIVVASGNYQTRELRYYDGTQMTVIQSTDTTLFDGFGFSYYWSNECTLAANGEPHCMAATQDGGSGVFAHRTDGRDVVVARTRDRLPTGESLITPLSVSSGLAGDVYFTADVFKDGVEYLALYQAVRQ